MKLAVIGANGNLGSRVVKQALDRGHEVKSIVYMCKTDCDGHEVIEKNLFDLTQEDLGESEVIISAFGGGFKADPVINKQAYEKYIELLNGTNKKIIAIAGAGSLYTDASHNMREYEVPGYSNTLSGISRNIRLGVDKIKERKDLNWTVVCPSRKFDLEGPFTNKYMVGTNEEIIFNEDGDSYVTYEDLASAMLDIAENGLYNNQVITIATVTVNKEEV
ncbi:NAD(P)H-binding protein [Clostridium baratii]|uniref:NAD(P)-dependent oxidoreductase n=1 Tax=Clostridium baratii TaxID=1561 RepID=UPI0029032C04|nr:NAD(P)H-binding protein [Clostridium baratii]MDU1054407.1 NAD(P)H-binding protein [Clostridium baratii]